MDFVATGLSERYWTPWGVSWVASYSEISGSDWPLVVYDFGLSGKTALQLRSFGVDVRKGTQSGTVRQSALRHVALDASRDGCRAIYFDADTWFQGSFANLQEGLDDRLCMTAGPGRGMVGGNSVAWRRYACVDALCCGSRGQCTLSILRGFFEPFTRLVPDAYDCSSLERLEDIDNLLCLDGKPVSAIHPAGELKVTAVGKGLLFHERHRDIWERYSTSKKVRHFGIRRRKNSDCK